MTESLLRISMAPTPCTVLHIDLTCSLDPLQHTLLLLKLLAHLVCAHKMYVTYGTQFLFLCMHHGITLTSSRRTQYMDKWQKMKRKTQRTQAKIMPRSLQVFSLTSKYTRTGFVLQYMLVSHSMDVAVHYHTRFLKVFGLVVVSIPKNFSVLPRPFQQSGPHCHCFVVNYRHGHA